MSIEKESAERAIGRQKQPIAVHKNGMKEVGEGSVGSQDQDQDLEWEWQLGVLSRNRRGRSGLTGDPGDPCGKPMGRKRTWRCLNCARSSATPLNVTQNKVVPYYNARVALAAFSSGCCYSCISIVLTHSAIILLIHYPLSIIHYPL